MVKLCIITYYDLTEALAEAAISLNKLSYDIYQIPLHKYIHDPDINVRMENYVDYSVNYIKNNQIDIVLWWFINIPTDDFKLIKDNTNVKYIYFNWDEPFNWFHSDVCGKSSYFDAVFITCDATRYRYIENGCKHAYFLPPAFSPKFNNINIEFNGHYYNKYNCDISFCCTNLYENTEMYPNQYISRKKLVDDIYNNQVKYGYKFHIYGPPHLGKKYPESYRGYVSYHDLHYVYCYSKINLCTHVMCNMDRYVNERVILIGGSGGFLLVDNIEGITNMFDPNSEITILDKENYIDQIRNILDNYDMYIDRRNNLFNNCINKYTYDHWAQFIHDKVILL